MMKTIGIIGYGRFGQLLADMSVGYFDVNIIEQAINKGLHIMATEDLRKVDLIFLAVPISELEELLMTIAPYLTSDQVVVDLCSVKVYPVKMMKKYIESAQIIATHPMFGPDSAKKGLEGLQVAVCPIRTQDDNLELVKTLWTRNNLTVIETTPEAHDHDTAYSQAFTYSLAKIILGTNIPDITFKTRSFNDIYEVAMLSARDTDQLFHDMLFYNPYFIDMKRKLENSMAKTKTILDEIAREQSSHIDNFKIST